MWVLKTAEGAEPPFTFRILPGNIKTVGRAPVSYTHLTLPTILRV